VADHHATFILQIPREINSSVSASQPAESARAGVGQVTKVFIPAAKPDKPLREYGFVHFTERSVVDKLIADAEKGVKPELDGNTLEVRWMNCCFWVPPPPLLCTAEISCQQMPLWRVPVEGEAERSWALPMFFLQGGVLL
jgi:hypothetical protein